MSTKLSKLLLFFILVGALSYLYVLNPASVTVQLSRSSAWSAPLALVLTTAFSLGMLVTSLLAFVYGAQMTYHHWRDRRRWQLEQQHAQQLVRVGELIRLEDFNRASNSLRRILEEDPKNTTARVLYAEALCNLRQYNEALAVLDDGRTLSEGSVEIPLLAAEIHRQQGNLTSALDNLVIVLRSEPTSPAALRGAVECATELEQFELAIDFQQRLIRAVSVDENQELERSLIGLLIKQAKKGATGDTLALRDGLLQLSKRARSSAIVSDELAHVELELGNTEAAAKLWAKAYGAEPTDIYLSKLASLWLGHDEPSRAVAAVKALLPRGDIGVADLPGQVFLLQLLLHLEMTEEATSQLQLTDRALQSVGEFPTKGALRKRLEKARAGLLARNGRPDEAYKALAAQLESSTGGGDSDPFFTAVVSGRELTPKRSVKTIEAPSPRLSTP